MKVLVSIVTVVLCLITLFVILLDAQRPIGLRISDFKFKSLSNRVSVSIDRILAGEARVFLIVGQSNAASHGEFVAPVVDEVYEYYNGRVYIAKEPMLGCSGYGGSPWLYCAAHFLDEAERVPIVLVNIAQGGSSIRDWLPEGKHGGRVNEVLKELSDHGLSVDALLWQQGEADANLMEGSVYAGYFRRLMSRWRSSGLTAPVFVAQSTFLKGKVDPDLNQAQFDLSTQMESVWRGPNLDNLGLWTRCDGTHFSEQGLVRAGEMWSECLKATLEVEEQNK